MSLRKTNISSIIIKYMEGKCNAKEKQILDDWLLEDSKNKDLLNDLITSENITNNLINYNLFNEEQAWNKILYKVNQGTGSIRPLNYNIFYYAAGILIFIIGFSFFNYKNISSGKDDLDKLVSGKIIRDSNGDILPATSGAYIITPAGDKKAIESNFKIDSSGRLIVGEVVSENSEKFTSDHYELIVPKAKFIQFILFDGSKIWVNANSHLKIPTKLYGNERRIEILNGEAYFEIEKYNDTKFIVDTQNGRVEVLGTKFNVNSYKSLFKTTLLEGSVKLIQAEKEQILIPNTSAIFANNKFLVSKADISSDLSWMNNVFYFNNYSIVRIARQIENWYGVKVFVDEGVTRQNNTYSGEIRRDVPLTKIKDMLEFISGLKVSIQDEQLNIDN